MSIVFDRATDYYDQTRALPQQIEQWLVEAVRDDVGLDRKSSILEIGVGTGRIALPLARAGYRYTGADLSRPMMNTLRSKASSVPINLVQADVAQLPFGDTTFDAVIAVHIFHLVSRWSDAMDEIKRALRSGGVLLHGHSKHEGAAEHELRTFMQDHASTLQPQNDDRLKWDEVNDQLRRRFGEPREVVSPPWQVTYTPRSIIDQFANRIWSATWSLRDEVLAAAVEAGRTRALERWGDLDTEFTSTYRFAWQVYGRDAG